MAANTKTTPKNVIDNTAKVIEESASKAQEQYFSMLEQSQAAAIEGFEAIVDAMGKIDVPAVPGLDAVVPNLNDVKVPVTMFDGAFDFGMKVLENQREFAHKMLAVTAKS